MMEIYQKAILRRLWPFWGDRDCLNAHKDMHNLKIFEKNLKHTPSKVLCPKAPWCNSRQPRCMRLGIGMPNGYDAWECRMGGTLMDSPLQSQARQRPGRAPGWQGGGGGQLQAFPKSHGKGALATPGKEKPPRTALFKLIIIWNLPSFIICRFLGLPFSSSLHLSATHDWSPKKYGNMAGEGGV